MNQLSDYEYFRTDNGVLYCGENLTILPLIKEHIDFIFTDPPYNCGKDYGVYKDNLLMAERKIRRLTPTEAETLMGWEPGWTAKGIFLDKNGNEVVKDISDSARYKACGNGVVSTMVYDICKVIDEFDKNICSKGIDKK